MPATHDPAHPTATGVPSAPAQVLPLKRHSNTPCPDGLALAVHVARVRADRLRLEYRLTGNWHGVVLPNRNNNPAPRSELWQHTCFEAFLATPGGSAYHEFNFSPSGDWAVFAFSAWRQRTADCSHALRPLLSLQHAPGAVQLSVDTPLPTAVYDGARHAAGAALGLSAVIAHADGRRCYWALAHPCDDPDFHARAGWLTTLPPAPGTDR